MSSSSSIPKTMRALLTAGAPKLPVVEVVPTPEPGPGQLLIKVAAVAVNPTDQKHADEVKTAGLTVGVDCAGTVVAAAPDVTGFQPGERVAAFIHGTRDPGVGTMAEYVVGFADLVWRVPDNLSFEEASTMNCSLWTAIQGLYHTPRLQLTAPPASVPHATAPWVLVWGGASSVGLFTIQLARLSGYRVIATASPKNAELVKSSGADVVVNYRDADVVEQIKKATDGGVAYGVDTVSLEDTQLASVRAFGLKGGELLVILGIDEGAAKLRADVQVKFTMLYSVFGRHFNFLGQVDLPVAPNDRPQMVPWMSKITELARDGKIKANPVKLWPGGLEAINDGFKYMREGKVSGEKLVFRVA